MISPSLAIPLSSVPSCQDPSLGKGSSCTLGLQCCFEPHGAAGPKEVCLCECVCVSVNVCECIYKHWCSCSALGYGACPGRDHRALPTLSLRPSVQDSDQVRCPVIRSLQACPMCLCPTVYHSVLALLSSAAYLPPVPSRFPPSTCICP